MEDIMKPTVSREFFEKDLPELIKNYAQDQGPGKIVTEILVQGGLSIRVEGTPMCSDAYVVIDYKIGTQANRAVIPYGAIVGINFRSEGAGAMGFRP